MPTINLSSVGLPGVGYQFAGTIKRLVFTNKDPISLTKHIWQLTAKERQRIADQLKIDIESLDGIILRIYDAYEGSGNNKKTGALTGEVTWKDAVVYNAKGYRTKLNYSVVGKLLSPRYYKIGDTLVEVNNSIARLVDKQELKTIALQELRQVGADDLWTLNSYPIIYDQICSYSQEKHLGVAPGLLPVSNGVLNINKGCLVATGDIYLTKMAVDFVPDATACPKISHMP